MNKIFFYTFLFTCTLALTSCESETDRKQREARIEQIKLENERQKEVERLEIEERERLKLQEKAIYDKYINNSLSTGKMPYAYCFGENKSCSNYGCSEVKVKTPFNSDVIVTIKKNGKVFRHAYIEKSSHYTFELPNGEYQTFFYYGKGWNPDKIMKETDCGPLMGGFVDKEHFGKDDPQYLKNTILTYELILQQNGNFSTKSSSSEEAF